MPALGKIGVEVLRERPCNPWFEAFARLSAKGSTNTLRKHLDPFQASKSRTASATEDA